MHVYLHACLNDTCMPGGVTKGCEPPYGWWKLNLDPLRQQHVLLTAILFFLMPRWGWVTVWTQNPGSCPVGNLWDMRTNGARNIHRKQLSKVTRSKGNKSSFPTAWLSCALRKMRRSKGRTSYRVSLQEQATGWACKDKLQGEPARTSYRVSLQGQTTGWAWANKLQGELLSHRETGTRLSWDERHREFLFFFKLVI